MLEKEEDYEVVEDILGEGQVEDILLQLYAIIDFLPDQLKERPWDYDREAHEVCFIRVWGLILFFSAGNGYLCPKSSRME